MLFVIGAFGTISKATKENLRERKFLKTETNKLTRKSQYCSVRGAVKICKTFMEFSGNWSPLHLIVQSQQYKH